MQKPLSILVLFGGESPEHDVSVISAQNVVSALQGTQHKVSLCYITRGGQWLLVDQVNSDVQGSILKPHLGSRQWVGDDNVQHSFDVIFPVLHGSHGEDGDVQGLARLMHTPMVGPSLIGAAVTMDKDMTKRLLRDAGVLVVDWICWRTNTPEPSYPKVTEQLGSPVFIKPAGAGSSIGVSKAATEQEFVDALKNAAQYDESVLIESAVAGNEYQVAVLGNQDPRLSDVCEIEIGADFHDFADKYNADSKAQFHIPARLSRQQTETVKRYAVDAYKAVSGRGMARVDFFMNSDGAIFLNEINAIPGFTGVSVYPKLWQAAGLGYTELIEKLIELAVSDKE